MVSRRHFTEQQTVDIPWEIAQQRAAFFTGAISMLFEVSWHRDAEIKQTPTRAEISYRTTTRASGAMNRQAAGPIV